MFFQALVVQGLNQLLLENVQKLSLRTRNGNVIIFCVKQHCNMKIHIKSDTIGYTLSNH